MPIRTSLLASKSINEDYVMKADAASRLGARLAFLSHSHKDRHLAIGLQQLLREAGWVLYIDWQDSTMPDSPNEITANKIKAKIDQASVFLYLSTANSDASRWCPWEIGYADKSRTPERIFIVPTQDERGTAHGNEYLKLYKRIDVKSLYETALHIYEANSITGKPINAINMPR